MATRVFVGGLTYHVRERDIEKFFSKYGKTKEIAMKTGFAFVEFDDYRDAGDVVYELDRKELLGEKVSVEMARGIPRGPNLRRVSGRLPVGDIVTTETLICAGVIAFYVPFVINKKSDETAELIDNK